VCITTNQSDTKYNPNPNPTTKQHAVVSMRLNYINDIALMSINYSNKTEIMQERALTSFAFINL